MWVMFVEAPGPFSSSPCGGDFHCFFMFCSSVVVEPTSSLSVLPSSSQELLSGLGEVSSEALEDVFFYIEHVELLVMPVLWCNWNTLLDYCPNVFEMARIISAELRDGNEDVISEYQERGK